MLLLSFVGGLSSLLLGIYFISKNLESYHFSMLKYFLHSFTKTPTRGFVFGTISTTFLQSSSAVTVLTIGFVNAGILSFNSAIGIILGTNVGTTFTTQIISLNINNLWYHFLIIGIFFSIIPIKKIQIIGKTLASFALILAGLHLMTWSTSPLKSNSYFLLVWSKLDNHIFYSALIGIISTALLQSSSAITAILLAFASHGYINLLTATAIVLGSNVGTCFTALIAVIHSTKAARKVALAHLILNIGGLIIFLPFISIYCSFIELTADSLTRQIANTHTIYNLICSLIVLPFSTAFANFVSWTYSLLNNRNC